MLLRPLGTTVKLATGAPFAKMTTGPSGMVEPAVCRVAVKVTDWLLLILAGVSVRESVVGEVCMETKFNGLGSV